MIKNIEANIVFNNGSTLSVLAPVDKSKYTSLQSKACTYKNTLLANVHTKKITVDEAKNLWTKNVCQKWNELVVPALKDSLPPEVIQHVDSFTPASNMLTLKLDVAESAE